MWPQQETDWEATGRYTNELNVLLQHAHKVRRSHCSRGERANPSNNKRRREEQQLIGLHINAVPPRTLVSDGTELALAASVSGQNTEDEAGTDTRTVFRLCYRGCFPRFQSGFAPKHTEELDTKASVFKEIFVLV